MSKSESLMTADPKESQKFLTYAIGYVALGIGVAFLGPLLPYLADKVDVSIGQISFIFIAQNLGYLIGSVFGSRLFDCFKSHPLMILSLSLMVVMGILIPLIHCFFLLLVVLWFFGLGFGIFAVGGTLNLVWLYKSRVSPYLIALHFSFGIGSVLAPIVISYVLGWSDGNLNWAIWTLVILFLPGFIGLISLASPENTAKKAHTGGVQPVNVQLIILITVLFFIAVGVQNGFGNWLFTYVLDLRIANSTSAALMTSIFWGSITVGRLFAIPISKKISSTMMLFVNFVLATTVLGLILVYPERGWMMWAGAAGLGLATSSIFPSLFSFAEARLEMTGRVTGIFFLGISLGMMALPMLLGQVFEYIGTYQMMLTLFGTSVLGLGTMIFLKVKRFQEKTRESEV